MNTRMRRPPRIFAAILMLIAILFAVGGVELIAVGGSFYYLLAGLAIGMAAALLWRGNPLGSRVYGLLLLATLIWSVFEAGFEMWPLITRLLALSVIGLWFLTPWTRRGLYNVGPPPLLKGRAGVVGAALAAIALVVVAYFATRETPAALSPRVAFTKSAEGDRTDWRHYGNTKAGTRFAQIDQINTQNVKDLKVAWRFRTGVAGSFKGTPIQIDDMLYVCDGANVIVALDAETGELQWKHDPQVKLPPMGAFGTSCRGVTYYRAPEGYKGECPTRILTATTDARLLAVDAQTGKVCTDFGNQGAVDLLEHMGEVKPGFYFATSPPVIAKDVAVIGGWVADNVEVGEPSGVIRAFNPLTGTLAWAWDMGRPGINTAPQGDEIYTRGTPNGWSLFSADDALGLVYIPTGNATPDYFGAQRTPEMEKYASSVVALDATNGSVRWSFQTVHHDIWDYDVPSQPVLVDLRSADGTVTPALVQGTKRGELFLLDRRDGKPLSPVEERPVPQGGVPEDWTAKTQPFSVGMPQFRGPDFKESDMWGLTPLDQLWCRIEFHKLRYEGHFTPPSERPSLQQPGNAGGFNWGSVAVDEENQLLIANPLVMSNRVQLVPRAKVTKDFRGAPQRGTPYAMTTMPWFSPLIVPCQKPPYGRLAVVDLQTRQLVWSKPLGTANEMGPFGMRIRLKLPMGVPQSAGTLVTRGGLIFVGGAMDRYFRAFDEKTGAELWSDRLPSSAQATPMTYLSPRTRRQMVVLTMPPLSRLPFGRPPPDPASADRRGETRRLYRGVCVAKREVTEVTEVT